ncbi:alpha/beta hydrolase [Nocardia sp. CA-135398]|uniref:alpha/beta hydrolase n=1 Tax=Nocardia sp. CA-135398 TaxID=3239977 RepID=UPI003D99037F
MNPSTSAYGNLLDPDAWAAAQVIAATLPKPIRELGPETARELLATRPREHPITAIDRVENLEIPSRAGIVGARLYRATSAADAPALLYMHGGGFILGTLDGVDELCRAIAARTGFVVVSLDYRLAPENPYPAALEDCFDAYLWLREHAVALHIDPDSIAVGGDSAGGALAAGLCLALRDGKLPLPISQVLAYPPVDDSFAAPSWTEFADAPLLTSADAKWLIEQYRGPDYRDQVDPLAAPMRAESLHSLPPALILTAEVDPIRDDAEVYAARLHRDGVAVTTIRYPGVFHGFFTEVGVFTKTEQAIEDVCDYLRRLTRP